MTHISHSLLLTSNTDYTKINRKNIYIYIYLVKHSFQATRRRAKRQPAQCRSTARRLSLLPGWKATPAPGRSRRERQGQGGFAADSAALPQPRAGGEGEVHRASRGQAAGPAAERVLFAGGGGRSAPGTSQASKENPQDTACFWPWLSDLLTLEGRA